MRGRYSFVVGTGGVGKGILFKLTDNHNLGRNESRIAELTNFKDYCKLHIILNYVAAFVRDALPVYAVSSVGDDEVGSEMLELMAQSGINNTYMKKRSGSKTMYAVCYQFPSGEGGNISSGNSANDLVSPEDIRGFFADIAVPHKGIVLAAPEVPVRTRLEILKYGRAHNCLNIASLLPGEVKAFAENGLFDLVDLLAVNKDEAQAIAAHADKQDGDDCTTAVHYLQSLNPAITVLITCGNKGAVTYSGDKKQVNPIIDNTVVNTAGAGDCFLGTVISALVKGVPLFADDTAEISSAQGIASLASAMKVGCSDTIHFDINKDSLYAFAKEKGIVFSRYVTSRFFDR